MEKIGRGSLRWLFIEVLKRNQAKSQAFNKLLALLGGEDAGGKGQDKRETT